MVAVCNCCYFLSKLSMLYRRHEVTGVTKGLHNNIVWFFFIRTLKLGMQILSPFYRIPISGVVLGVGLVICKLWSGKPVKCKQTCELSLWLGVTVMSHACNKLANYRTGFAVRTMLVTCWQFGLVVTCWPRST